MNSGLKQHQNSVNNNTDASKPRGNSSGQGPTPSGNTQASGSFKSADSSVQGNTLNKTGFNQ
jgi:hypothetical protein